MLFLYYGQNASYRPVIIYETEWQSTADADAFAVCGSIGVGSKWETEERSLSVEMLC